MMNAQQCLQRLRDVKDVAFATVDQQGRPQVRIIDVMLIENETLYFCTARGKDFYCQLIANGQVAVTGMNKDFQTVRLNGAAAKLPDQKHWIDRIFEANPVMNSVYPGNCRYILEAFCINQGSIEFFDLGQSPIYRAYFSFGNAAKQKKGFYITASCIGCGTCQNDCPQQCIAQDTPYRINQSHCLHCGLCFESCPAQAIIKQEE